MQRLRPLQRLWPRPTCRPRLLHSRSFCSGHIAHEHPNKDTALRREISYSTPEVLGSWDVQGQSIQGSQRHLVVTASGPDRPGIVARLSKRVLDSGGNVEESRMARLAGEFSILMLITFDVTTTRKAEQLRNSLLQIDGLQVNTRWTTDDHLKEPRPQRKFRKMLLRGVDMPDFSGGFCPQVWWQISRSHEGLVMEILSLYDKPRSHVMGLVYNVTEFLSSYGVNIENLETHTQEAPLGGATLFLMEGVITMPVEVSTSVLIQNLETLQATLGVEIIVSNLPDATPNKILVPSSSPENLP